MEKWKEKGKELEELIRPLTYPLAVALFENESDFPEDVRRPEEGIALCQALTLSRTRGWTVGITEENSGCTAVNVGFEWSRIVDESTVGEFFVMGGYAEDKSIGEKIAEDLYRLKQGKYDGVVVSPLTRTKVEPDVVLVYGNPAQMMRLIQGSMYKTGEKFTTEMGGVAASCNAGIIQTFKKKECQLIVPGNGDRVFAATQGDEMLFTIPKEKLEDLIENTKKQKFAKYPIPAVMQTPPPFPGLEELNEVYKQAKFTCRVGLDKEKIQDSCLEKTNALL